MRYAQLRKYDIANGPGIRTSVFVPGCRRHCPGCFNPEYQKFNAGKKIDHDFWVTFYEYLENPNVSGLTILGGEPFEPENVKTTYSLAVCTWLVEKSVWIYSGFTFEEIKADACKSKVLPFCNVLVDGPFIEVLKDPSLRFRGSSNQRIIDVQKSLETGKVILWEDT